MKMLKQGLLLAVFGVIVGVYPAVAQDDAHAHHNHADHANHVAAPAPKKAATKVAADPHAGHVMPAPAASDDPATAALNTAMAKMHADMNVPITGDPDADFIRGMIPHHEGAVAMAQIVLKYGDDPEARQLARAILRAQRGEIAYMRRWLELRQIPEREAINLNR